MEDLLDRLTGIYSFGDAEKGGRIWYEALTRRKVIAESWDGAFFFRLDKNVKTLGRGTVLSDEGIIRDYPHINRVVHLENGIRRNLKGEYYVEEKVDGYNIRIASLSGKVLAFSRGGFVCPFSTDRMAEFIDCDRFFRENPSLVLCCEVAGPGNPYNVESPPYIDEDVRFFVFDIMEKDTGRLLPVGERYRLIDEYGLPGVEVFGLFTPGDADRVRELVLRLDRERREGIVMKPVGDGARFIKYVTPYSHIHDLMVGSRIIKDLSPGYYTKRIAMAAFSLKELGLDARSMAAELGAALVLPIMEVQDDVLGGRAIDEVFSIRMRNPVNIDRLFEHLKRSPVDIAVDSREKSGEYYLVRFRRIYRKATSFVKSGLRGSTFID